MSLEARDSAAEPTWASSCIILLFLIDRDSFSLLISVSCCDIVLLQVVNAVWRKPVSGFSTRILDDLCLIQLLGNTGSVLMVGVGPGCEYRGLEAGPWEEVICSGVFCICVAAMLACTSECATAVVAVT